MKTHAEFPNLFIVDHPLVQHKLSQMRDKNCPMGSFRALLKEISLLMGYELTENLPVRTQKIATPMMEMEAPFLAGPEPVIVPILRAGLGMADGLQDLMPMAAIGHVGLYRDEETHEPVEYLVRLPKPEGRFFILVDPMLATGHSARHAVDVLVKRGIMPDHIRFMSLVCAPEGVRAFHAAYPQIPVYTAALDDHLNDKAYIVPGLGDAGDRIFGTF